MTRILWYGACVVVLAWSWAMLPRAIMGPLPAVTWGCTTDFECYGHGGYEIDGHIDGFEHVGATEGDVR